MTDNFIKEEINTQNRVAGFYENKRYQKSYSLAYHAWWAKKMLSLVRLKNPILDNGCGPGFMAEFLKGYETVGLDISTEMVKLAQKKYSRVVQGDAQNLPFAAASFQTVVNRGVLHHLADPQRGVDEISRILAPGGEAVFAESTMNIINFLPRKLLRGTKHFSHLHRNFPEKELKKIIASRLEIKKVYYFGYLAYLLFVAPDVIDVYKFFPFKRFFTPFLIKIDEFISEIPFLKKHLCWCIMIVAQKHS